MISNFCKVSSFYLHFFSLTFKMISAELRSLINLSIIRWFTWEVLIIGNTDIPHFIALCFIVLCSYCILKQIESLWQTCVKQVCKLHFSNSSVHFMSLCHVLVTLTIFQTFFFYYYISYSAPWTSAI